MAMSRDVEQMLWTSRTHFASVLQRMAEERAERQREIGRRIARLREAKGWNQPDFAHKIGVSPSTVSRWERGLNHAYRENVRKIAKVLGVSLAEIEPPESEPDILGQLEHIEESISTLSAELHEIDLRLVQIYELLTAGGEEATATDDEEAVDALDQLSEAVESPSDPAPDQSETPAEVPPHRPA